MLFDLYTSLSKTAKLFFSVKSKFVKCVNFIFLINMFYYFFLDVIIPTTYICRKSWNCDEAT